MFGRKSGSEAQRLVRDVRKVARSPDYQRGRDAAARILDADPDVQAEALQLLVRAQRKSDLNWLFDEPIRRLLQRKLPLTEGALRELLDWDSFMAPYGVLLGALERYLKTAECTPDLRKSIVAFRAIVAGRAGPKKAPEWDARIGKLLGEEVGETPRLALCEQQPWARRLAADLEQLEPPHDQALLGLLAHAATADGGKPAAKWRKRAQELGEPLPGDLVRSALCVWCGQFDTPADEPIGRGWSHSEWAVPDVNAELMKGLLWLSPAYADETLVRAVAAAGLSGQRKIPQVGPRASKVTNAAIWALGATDHPLAIAQLAILRSRIRNKSVQKQIDKAMTAVAGRLGVSANEVEELAVPTFGLTDVGALDVTLGEFTAELRVTGSGSTAIGWRKPDGEPQKTVPKAVKDEHAEELRELEATAKDIEKLLPAQRDRLDRLHLEQATWPLDVWRERYLDHVLVGTLARRLIWRLTDADGGARRTACWFDGALVDRDGAPVDVDPGRDHVALWHPIGEPEDEVLAWRVFFEERQLVQPFKQAHREVYLLTDAERTTGVYSNRYAAHILKQHQFNALCAVRGWRNSLRLLVDDEYPPATLDLPEWSVRAEFWIEGLGDDYGTDTNETGTFLYVATDQVRFYETAAAQNVAHAGGGGYGSGYGDEAAEPLPLDRIDPLVFSEVMRDVDLFVGVASVGNDPTWMDGGGDARRQDYWHDYSFGELSATAATRKELLERLIPRLKIADRCSFRDRFLVVRGDLRTYKIHLGSGNILMEPKDQYLCIVPGRGAIRGPASKVFLPFEGDRTLSIILSKAFLLAEDGRIGDETILSQIR